MDTIQKVLVKAKRKDLAQKYFKMISFNENEQKFENQTEEFSRKMTSSIVSTIIRRRKYVNENDWIVVYEVKFDGLAAVDVWIDFKPYTSGQAEIYLSNTYLEHFKLAANKIFGKDIKILREETLFTIKSK